MTVTDVLLHAGADSHGALGYGVLPSSPVALALIAAGLLLIAFGLYRLHTYEEPSAPVEEEPDA